MAPRETPGIAAMAVGLVLIGMLAGMLAGAWALAAGAGIAMVLLAYAGTGAAGVLLGAGLALLPRPALAGGLPGRA
jgi:hypothetical protein